MLTTLSGSICLPLFRFYGIGNIMYFYRAFDRGVRKSYTWSPCMNWFHGVYVIYLSFDPSGQPPLSEKIAVKFVTSSADPGPIQLGTCLSTVAIDL